MAGFGWLGAAGATQAGMEGMNLLEQALNRRRLTDMQQQEVGLKKEQIGLQRDQSNLSRASTLATLGLTDQAADLLGVSRGEVDDPVYREIAAKLLVQRLTPPADLQGAVTRELFPPEEPDPNTRLGQSFNRLRTGGARTAPPAESAGGPTLGLNPRLSLGEARTQMPTGGPPTQVGSTDRLGLAMKLLTAGKDNPQMTHPVEYMAYKYATEGEAATGPLGKQAWDSVVQGKGVTLESLRLKLEAAAQKAENDVNELKLKIRKLEEVDKPKVELERTDVQTRQRVAETGAARAKTEQQNVEQKAVEIDRKAIADFETEINRVHQQFGAERGATPLDEASQADLKSRTRSKIQGLFDREISRRRQRGATSEELKALEQQKLDAMAPYRPALTGPGRINVR